MKTVSHMTHLKMDLRVDEKGATVNDKKKQTLLLMKKPKTNVNGGR